VLELTSNTWWVLIVAAVAGGAGGLAAALILLDPTQTKDARPTGTAALGVVVIRTAVGVAASVAFLFFFPTEIRTTVVARGTTTTVTVYPFLKVVALGIVVGSGGSAVLSAMQSKALAMVNQGKALADKETMRATAVTALSALPAMAAEAARAGAAERVEVVKAAATEQLLHSAQALPPSVARATEGSAVQVRQNYADLLGVEVDQLPTVRLDEAREEVAGVVDAVPEAVDAHVRASVRSEVAPIIDAINDL
jgi:hypothetical protein